MVNLMIMVSSCFVNSLIVPICPFSVALGHFAITRENIFYGESANGSAWKSLIDGHAGDYTGLPGIDWPEVLYKVIKMRLPFTSIRGGHDMIYKFRNISYHRISDTDSSKLMIMVF